jgi:GT2 family glycosyltransferase
MLTRCLDSLELDTSAEAEVLVIDNGPEGDEIEQARRRNAVHVLGDGVNLGYAAGSNLGAHSASGEVLFFLNPDTVVEPGTLGALARRLEDKSIAIAMPRLRLLDEPELLNSRGAAVHLSGLAWSDGFRVPASSVDGPLEIAYANGSVLGIRRALFEELGGFTEEYFIYLEDLELGWRARMRGLRVVLDPAGDVLHEYEHRRNPTKNYFMERNRLVFVGTVYSLRLLVLLAPVLAAAEAGLILVALREGWLTNKLDGWRWLARHGLWLLRHRRRLQAARTVRDSQLAHYLTPTVNPKMISVPRPVRAANRLVSGYWSLAQRLL